MTINQRLCEKYLGEWSRVDRARTRGGNRQRRKRRSHPPGCDSIFGLWYLRSIRRKLYIIRVKQYLIYENEKCPGTIHKVGIVLFIPDFLSVRSCVRSEIREKEIKIFSRLGLVKSSDRRLETNRETDIKKESRSSVTPRILFYFFFHCDVLGSTGVIQRYSYANRENFHCNQRGDREEHLSGTSRTDEHRCLGRTYDRFRNNHRRFIKRNAKKLHSVFFSASSYTGQCTQFTQIYILNV